MLKELNRTTAQVTNNYPVKVLQFGEGNFLRAFVDWMIDLLNENANFNGSVQLIQPRGNSMTSLINKQDGLYHVILNGLKGGKSFEEIRLITCVKGCISPFDNYEAFLALAENPELEIIFSNTTEAGIAFDANDTDYSKLPNSFPAKLTALLYHRFTAFKGEQDKSLIIIPCELIDKNGTNLKSIILKYCDLWKLPTEFKEWLNLSIFCNTLVDRIVPGFPKDTIEEKQKAIGYIDNLLVTAEPFYLWVIETKAEETERLTSVFPINKVGLDVKLVQDQSPYRTRKVRILNGAHTAMVPVAYLHGLRTVREAVEDSFVNKFIRAAVFDEIIPTLDLDKGELTQFSNDVLERFQNPFIRHELISISLNSVSKYKVRVLPSVLEFIKRKNALPEKLLFSLACLIRFYKASWRSDTIPVNDTESVLQFMKSAWSQAMISATVNQVLSNKDFWDEDLTQIPGLESLVTGYLEQIDKSESVEMSVAGS